MDDFKRSQFPAFGNWDYSDGLPITQYFETARHAGLIRYNYGEQDLYGGGSYDLYTTTMTDDDLIKKPSITVVPHRKAKAKRAGRPYTQAEQQKNQGKVYDLTVPHSITHRAVPPTNPKAVDEDLYKIPPELLYKDSNKRKKMFGFLSRCLVPNCAV